MEIASSDEERTTILPLGLPFHRKTGPRMLDSLLVVEGENDDITGPGQAAAALDLCTGLAAGDRHHHLQPGVGHMGLFSGSRWRSDVLPRVALHIVAA